MIEAALLFSKASILLNSYTSLIYMEATTQGNTTLEGHYTKYKSSLTGMVSEGDCDLPRSYRFCLKLRLGHVSCNKPLCGNEIGCISETKVVSECRKCRFRDLIFSNFPWGHAPGPSRRSSWPSALTRFVAQMLSWLLRSCSYLF